MSEYITVNAPCGPVVAGVENGVLHARGIPYAVAGRFERPAPAPSFADPFEAHTQSPAAPQIPSALLDDMFGSGFVADEQDENCLHLSVTAPADLADQTPADRADQTPAGPADQTPAREGAPVMVWIHGGSYVAGSGDATMLEPTALVSEQHVIVVTVTYRLGVLGYLGDGVERPANLGLLDQIAALTWVRRNIHAFGGNPDNVTTFGQSAGGDAVAHLMTLPDAPALFRRAIVQSSPPSDEKRRKATAAMLSVTGDLAADTPLADVLAAQVRAERAARAADRTAAMPFGVQYRHDPLPSLAQCRSQRSRNAPAIDLLVGHTAEEPLFFLPAVPALEKATRLPIVGGLLRWAFSATVTHLVYRRPARSLAREHAAAGGRTHRYVIDWPGRAGPYGAAHTIDLTLLFGSPQRWAETNLLRGLRAEEIHRAGATVRQVWGDFARGSELPDRDVKGVISVRGVS